MRSTKTMKMAQMAILIAIVLIMAFTPLGYLKTAGLEISLITIPVAIAAMVLGPKEGAVIGAVFGLTSFYQCFGMSTFGATLLNINPFLTFLVCVPTRILEGYVAGLIFPWLLKADKTKTIGFFLGGLITAVCNTVLFVGVLLLCFWNTEYIQSLNAAGANILLFGAIFVGVNGVVEWIATTAAGGVIAKALAKIVKNA